MPEKPDQAIPKKFRGGPVGETRRVQEAEAAAGAPAAGAPLEGTLSGLASVLLGEGGAGAVLESNPVAEREEPPALPLTGILAGDLEGPASTGPWLGQSRAEAPAPATDWWAARFPLDGTGRPSITAKAILAAFGSYTNCLDALIDQSIPEAYLEGFGEVIPAGDIGARAMLRMVWSVRDLIQLQAELVRVQRATLELLKGAASATGQAATGPTL